MVKNEKILTKKNDEGKVIIKTCNLRKWYTVKKRIFSKNTCTIKAVDGISIDIIKGETFGLVGESGCGKTTFGKVMLGLLEPTEGKMCINGTDFFSLAPLERRRMCANMQIIFQDPYSSLNPRMSVGSIIAEPLKIHKVASGKLLWDRVYQLLEVVGLSPEYINRYPHQFSGGQRQRIGIARALALNPMFIVCDEPISALDVSIRSQIINLLKDLQMQFSLTYLFITHDLSVVDNICDRVAVMYLGKIVELADTDNLFNGSMHPYTQALLSAIPIANPKLKRERLLLKGDVPSPINPPTGCRFRTRCRMATEICKTEPILKNLGDNHYVACHLI